jgi:hypothetical protein
MIGIGRIIEEIASKDAEIDRLNELLRGEGANRYWEGRWRDDQNVISILRAELSQELELIDHLRTELDAAKVNWQAVQKLKAELNEARRDAQNVRRCWRDEVAVLRRRLL